MTTIRESILQALKTKLVAITGATVYRSRVDAFLRSETNAVLLTWQTDIPLQDTLSKILWSLKFKVSVLSRGDVPDSTADAMVSDVHEALMAEPTLGGLCLDIQPGPADLQLIQADATGGVVSSEFVALYRTNLQDLETA